MSRILAVAAVMAGLTFVAVPARACDSNYPWLCKPVPSIDPPETAATTEPAKPAKPPAIANRQAAKAKAAKAERAAAASRKSAARKVAMRRWAARARVAKLAAARKAADVAAEKAEQAESRKAATDIPPPARRVVTPPPPRMLDGMGQGSTGFASMWAERTAAAAEPVPAEPAPAATGPAALEAAAQTAAPGTAEAQADPVSTNSVSVTAQNEVNAIDLAAPQPAAASDSSWVRNLFLAFGGLLAVGSALRFFI